MTTSLPWTLIIAWSGFFGFLNTHQRHATHFKGSSASFHLALNSSALLACLVGLGLLIYYYFQVAWYWPAILFVVGSIIGGVVFGILDAVVGAFNISVLAFIGWPACAVWFFLIARSIQP